MQRVAMYLHEYVSIATVVYLHVASPVVSRMFASVGLSSEPYTYVAGVRAQPPTYDRDGEVW